MNWGVVVGSLEKNSFVSEGGRDDGKQEGASAFHSRDHPACTGVLPSLSLKALSHSCTKENLNIAFSTVSLRTYMKLLGLLSLQYIPRSYHSIASYPLLACLCLLRSALHSHMYILLSSTLVVRCPFKHVDSCISHSSHVAHPQFGSSFSLAYLSNCLILIVSSSVRLLRDS